MAPGHGCNGRCPTACTKQNDLSWQPNIATKKDGQKPSRSLSQKEAVLNIALLLG